MLKLLVIDDGGLGAHVVALGTRDLLPGLSILSSLLVAMAIRESLKSTFHFKVIRIFSLVSI